MGDEERRGLLCIGPEGVGESERDTEGLFDSTAREWPKVIPTVVCAAGEEVKGSRGS